MESVERIIENGIHQLMMKISNVHQFNSEQVLQEFAFHLEFMEKNFHCVLKKPSRMMVSVFKIFDWIMSEEHQGKLNFPDTIFTKATINIFRMDTSVDIAAFAQEFILSIPIIMSILRKCSIKNFKSVNAGWSFVCRWVSVLSSKIPEINLPFLEIINQLNEQSEKLLRTLLSQENLHTAYSADSFLDNIIKFYVTKLSVLCKKINHDRVWNNLICSQISSILLKLGSTENLFFVACNLKTKEKSNTFDTVLSSIFDSQNLSLHNKFLFIEDLLLHKQMNNTELWGFPNFQCGFIARAQLKYWINILKAEFVLSNPSVFEQLISNHLLNLCREAIGLDPTFNDFLLQQKKHLLVSIVSGIHCMDEKAWALMEGSLWMNWLESDLQIMSRVFEETLVILSLQTSSNVVETWVNQILLPLYKEYQNQPAKQKKVADLLYQFQRAHQIRFPRHISLDETKLLLHSELPLNDSILDEMLRRWQHQSQFTIFSSNDALLCHLECCIQIMSKLAERMEDSSPEGPLKDSELFSLNQLLAVTICKSLKSNPEVKRSIVDKTVIYEISLYGLAYSLDNLLEHQSHPQFHTIKQNIIHTLFYLFDLLDIFMNEINPEGLLSCLKELVNWKTNKIPGLPVHKVLEYAKKFHAILNEGEIKQEVEQKIMFLAS